LGLALKFPRLPAALMALGCLFCLGLLGADSLLPELGSTDGDAGVQASIAPLPLSFEPNAGRAPRDVDFIAHSVAGGALALSPTGAVLALPEGKHGSRALGLELEGADPRASARGVSELPGKANVFLGNHPEKWRSGLPTYSRVRYQRVYPGVDLDYYGNQRRLEYDFRLAAHADPTRIGLNLRGADSLRIAANGDLVIGVGKREIRQAAPVAYQTIEGERRPVESSYALHGSTIRFRLDAYDHSRPLVIDPVVLAYSTYLGGGSNDYGNGIAVDSAGAAYVTGQTFSTFPAQDIFQTDQGGADAFVTKLNPDSGGAVTLAYSTYLGGGSDDTGNGIAVDPTGAAYVIGSTISTDFPTQDQFQADAGDGDYDAFVAKLDPDTGGAVTLAYSTYLGATAYNPLGIEDIGNGIAVDSAGAAYVTGQTYSGFPTQDQFQTDQTGADAFVTKLNPDTGGAVTLAYSTYLGGGDLETGYGIAVDSAGAAYVTGSTASTSFPTQDQFQVNQPGTDVFVTRLNPDTGGAVTLAYSTYLGSGGEEAGLGIAVDGANAAYVTGKTSSNALIGEFPTQDPLFATNQSLSQGTPNPGGEDAFVTKLNPDGGGVVSLAYSTYLGGNYGDRGRGVAVDAGGAAYVTGEAESTNFPTKDPFQTDPSVYKDPFVTKLNPDGGGAVSLAYSTYLGGGADDAGNGIAVDPAAAAYVVGSTTSADATPFPTQDAFQSTNQALSDAFVARLIYVPPSPPPSGGGSSPPASTPSTLSAPAATGQRAAALKKCKHKHGRARANCKKRANQLPI
jgi:hypothetical protein